MSERYPEEGANHFRLNGDEVEPGRGAFLIAFLNEEPIGCGAVRRIKEDTVETKRMYVASHARGMGLGRKILLALVDAARALEVTRLVLETGKRQPESIALYHHLGFERIPAFGEYKNSPLSICMGKNM